jgi:hypothetical protein
LRHLHPTWTEMPAARRVCDGWSLVVLNEFTVWETLAPNAFLFACLAPDQPLAGKFLPWCGFRLPGGYGTAKLIKRYSYLNDSIGSRFAALNAG